MKRFGAKAVGLAVASLLALAGTAIGTRVLTEVVNTDVYGEFKLTVGVGMLIVGVIFRPLTAYAMRAYHDAANDDDGAFVSEGRRAIASSAVVVGAIAIAGSLLIAVATGDFRLLAIGLVASLLAAATAAVGFETGLLNTKGSVLTAASYRAIAAILLPIAAALAAIATGYSAAAMVLAQAVVILFAAYFLRRFTPGGDPQVDTRAWIRGSLPFAIPLAAVGLVAWLFNLGDRYLLAALTDASEVGVYAAAYALAAAPLAALGSLLPTLAYEPLYRVAASGSETKRRSVSTRLLGLQTLVVAMGVTVVALLAPIAVRLLLASDYREGAVPIMRWVALGQGFQVLSFALDLDSYSIGRTRRVLIAYSVAATVALVLNLLLVPRLGALGAARATAASGMAYFVLMLLMSRIGIRDATTGSSLHP